MVGAGWLLFMPMVLGLPLASVGAILGMCESSWHKPRGSMGSRWMLGIGGLLCLPGIIVLSLYLLG